MILAGDQIDASLGVRFGLSTLAAAGFGNLISDVMGVGLGDAIESVAQRMGFRAPALTPYQLDLLITRRVKMVASAIGVAVGCLIGMAPLLLLHDRKPVYFDDNEVRLFETTFAPHGVSTAQFFSLLHLGRWHVAEAGTVIVHEGGVLDRVLLLHDGEAQAFQGALGERVHACTYAGKESHVEPAALDGVPVRNIIGGSALIDNQLEGQPYPNEVVLTRRTTYVEWPADRLRAAMRDDKAVETAVISMLYRDLLCGMRLQRKKSREEETALRRAEYRTLLQVVLADGYVHPTERALLSDYRAKHCIAEEEHTALMKELNWSESEWREGIGAHIKEIRKREGGRISGVHPPSPSPPQ